ncbi:9577_t:CDS:2, partial [Gigaspora rosea]
KKKVKPFWEEITNEIRVMKEASKIDVKSRILEIVDKYNYANEYSIESYANVEGINTNVRSTLNDIKNLKGCKMNEIAKCICETVYYMDLKKDDPLLSGIIDLRCVPVQLKSHLIERELWDSVNKEIHLEEVPEDYTNYIRCIVTNDDDRIPDKFYDPIFKEELKMYLLLIDLEGRRLYVMMILSWSIWNHQIINPIIEFLLNNTERLTYQWDNGVILSTVHERETSYGPNRPNNVAHIEENRIRLMKLGNCFFSSYFKYKHDFDERSFNGEVNLFFLQSHGYNLTFSIMDYEFYPFYRVRSVENVILPIESGPNLLRETQNLFKVLYNFQQRLKEMVTLLDKMDKTAQYDGPKTPNSNFKVQIGIFKTP